MTLASVVFFLGVSSISSLLPMAAVPPSAQATDPQAAQTQTAPPQTPEAKPDTPPTAPTRKSPNAPSKRSQRKKKTDACKDSPTSGTGAASAPAPGGAPGHATGLSADRKDCPPPKIVVRQGGTSEPSIQLAGGAPGVQSTQAKDNVTQMLDSTGENLKKLSERQLSATEQDTVAQIRQYMDQSKTAVTAGDTERARTLAWKAQTLSEDLVNPKK